MFFIFAIANVKTMEIGKAYPSVLLFLLVASMAIAIADSALSGIHPSLFILSSFASLALCIRIHRNLREDKQETQP